MCLGLSDTIMYKCIYVYTVCPLLLHSLVLSFFKNSLSIANLVLEPFMASVPCSLKYKIKIRNVKKYSTSVVMAVACFQLALV